MSDSNELALSGEDQVPAGPSEAFTLMPRTIAEAHEYAKLIASSDLVPPDYRGKAANVLVAVQMGAELGLKPLQAVQNIAVVNGRPTVYGDALIALVRASPACEWVHEHVDEETMTAICIAKRRGQHEERRTFSQADAQAAGLWGRQGPWKQYPKRMLQMRARSWCLRDLFPDVLKGLAVAEEVRDIIDVTPVVGIASEGNNEAVSRASRVAARLSERAQATRRKTTEASTKADEEKPTNGSQDEPMANVPAPGAAEAISMIAKATTEDELEVCAKAVNQLDAAERRQPGRALLARIRDLKGDAA